MKYGILTFQDTTNFGSALQSYALCKAIRQCGVECEIIDYKCAAIEERELGRKDGSVLKKCLRYILFGCQNDKKNKALRRFLVTESMISRNPYTKDTISNANKVYDGFISGSDIIWGVDITKGDMTYFLNFVEDGKKKFAFASSIGNKWEGQYEEQIRQALKRYDDIYVREENAVRMVEEDGETKASLVCDPTMLLNKDVWSDMASDRYRNRKYILVYFGNVDLYNYAKKLADGIKAKVYVINYGLPIKGVTNIRPVSIAEFLGLIKNAQGILTGSYHGMLYSIYFHKQFEVFNRAHTSRMETVLNVLGLQDRVFGQSDLNDKIDYQAVGEKVNHFREDSLQKLKSMLMEG